MGIFPLAFCVKEVKDDSHLRNIVKAVFLGSQRSDFHSHAFLLPLQKTLIFSSSLKHKPKTATSFSAVKAQAIG
jgi:hypothetical protein